MTQDQLRDQLVASFKNRALVYHLLFEEMSAEFGEAKATEVMKRAIKKRGLQNGAKYARFAPGDLAGLKSAFVGGSPADGTLFEPEVENQTDDALDVKFHRCPLKEAWLEAGLPEEKVAKLCEIAAEVDYGTFESAGFAFRADTYKPGGDGCCHLHIRRK